MDGEGYPLKCKLAVGGGIFAFLAILFLACMVGSIHTIQEGSVGIYYVQGKGSTGQDTCPAGPDQIWTQFFS